MRIKVESVTHTTLGDYTWLVDVDTGTVYAHCANTGVIAKFDGTKLTDEEAFAVHLALQTYSEKQCASGYAAWVFPQCRGSGSPQWGWTNVGSSEWTFGTWNRGKGDGQ